MIRILITGSRDWEDRKLIEDTLTTLRFKAEDTTLVSGNCPTGADLICEEIADDLGWTVEKHPADWDKYGKRAGYIRNSAMVKEGADLCLAFVRNNSRGATMTAEFARNAYIKTYIIRHPEDS